MFTGIGIDKALAPYPSQVIDDIGTSELGELMQSTELQNLIRSADYVVRRDPSMSTLAAYILAAFIMGALCGKTERVN